MSSISSNHNTMRLDMNYKKKTVKNTNIWRLSNTFQNNQQVTKKSKGKLKKILDTNEIEKMTTQNL